MGNPFMAGALSRIAEGAQRVVQAPARAVRNFGQRAAARTAGRLEGVERQVARGRQAEDLMFNRRLERAAKAKGINPQATREQLKPGGSGYGLNTTPAPVQFARPAPVDVGGGKVLGPGGKVRKAPAHAAGAAEGARRAAPPPSRRSTRERIPRERAPAKEEAKPKGKWGRRLMIAGLAVPAAAAGMGAYGAASQNAAMNRQSQMAPPMAMTPGY